MKNLEIATFINELASDKATPGGGSVSALLGALATSLAAMSANLTINKKGYEDVNEIMVDLGGHLKTKSIELLDYINKDVEVFNKVMDSYKLPKSNEEEIKVRKEKINEATKEAYKVPLSLAREIAKELDNIKLCFYKGNKNVKSDALMSAILARSAILSSLANVYINLNSLPETLETELVRNELEEMKKRVIELEVELINNSNYFKI